MPKLKITVIGTINKDTIIFPTGKRTESFGGIMYNLSALAGLGGKWVSIYPICNLGYDVYNEVEKILKRYKNVKLNGINKVRKKNNHAFLFIDQNNQRKEILQNRVPALRFDQVKPYLGSNLILINFISGFDIKLDDLKKIRRKTDALTFMDVHSLTLGIDKDGKRFLKAPKDWQEYIKQADIVQTNLIELSTLSGKELRSWKEAQDFGKHVLSLGPCMLLVTLGEDGAVMIQREGKEYQFKKCKGIKVRGFKDATGCGDVFSAGFLVCYFHTSDFVRSLVFANRVAAEKCKISGVEGVAKVLKKFALVDTR
jgi:sugar/nucleoside kinase (ribokinase family)